MQKESKLSWFFRAGLFSVIGAHVMDPGQNLLTDWGSQAHVDRIYRGGYDVTQEMRPLGKAYAALTPWADSEFMETVVGFAGIMGLVLIEPDLTLLTLKAGAPLKALSKAAKLSPLLIKSAFKPALADWMRMIEEGKAAGKASEDVLKEIEGTLTPGGPQWALMQAVRMDWAAELLADGANLSGVRRQSMFQDLKAVLDATEEAAKAASRKLGKSKAALDRAGASKTQAIRAKDQAIEALDMAKEERAFAESMMEVLVEEERLLAQVNAVAASHGLSLRKLIELYHPSKAAELTRSLEPLRDRVASIVEMLASDLGESSATLKRLLAEGADLSGMLDPRLLAEHSRLTTEIAEAGRKTAESALVQSFLGVRQSRMWAVEKMAHIFASNGLTFPRALEAFKAPKGLIRAVDGAAVDAGPALLSRRMTRSRSLGRAATKAVSRTQKALDDLAAEADAGVVAATSAVVSKDKAYQAALEKYGSMVGVYARAKAAARQSGEGAIESLQKVLRRTHDMADVFADMIRRGTDKVQDASKADLVARKFATDASANGAQILKALQEAYDPSALEAAGKAYPEVLSMLASKTPVPKSDYAAVFDLERAAFTAQEHARLQQFAVPKLALETVKQTPTVQSIWKNAGEPGYWLARGLRAGTQLAQAVDPVLSRGLANAPDIVKDVYRRAYERFQTADTHINRIAAQTMAEARAKGLGTEDAIAHIHLAMRQLLLTNKKFFVGEALVTANQGGMTIAQKALTYLKMLAKTTDDAWGSDLTVQSLSRAWAPPGDASIEGAAAASRKLRKLVEDMESHGSFLDVVMEAMRATMAGVQRAADTHSVATRFIYRGLLHGSTQHDAIYDLTRTTGLGLSAEAARGLDFITNKAAAKSFTPAELSAGIAEARKVVSRYSLPLTQEMASGKAAKAWSLMPGILSEGAKTSNDLVRLASADDHVLEVPRYLMEALNQIPTGLAKELQQYSSGTPWLGRVTSDLMRMWRISVVNGWLFPRIAHFTNTFFGDFSQLATKYGLGTATRISGQHLFNHIPFVGPKVADALSTWSRTNSLMPGIVNPQMSAVMRGADDVLIETADGPISGRRMLREANEDGMLDSLSSADLAEALGRAKPERMGSLFGDLLTQPSRWVRNTAEFMETLQHRIRVQTYLEARTGALTGTPLTRAEAKESVLETLFDWRLGTTSWEAETIGRVGVFWTLRRQMLRQIGAAISEGYTKAGDGQYLWSALTGQTMLGRIRKMGALMEAVPEAVYWTDPDAAVNDEAQFNEWAIRQTPWWRDVQPLLMSRRLDEGREAWYSEVAGKPVTYESLILPSLTTIDSLYMVHLMVNSAAATSIHGLSSLGLAPNVTAASIQKTWEAAVDDFAGTFGPGFEDLINNALRPVLGESGRRSSRGVPVTAQQAAFLTRLGWHEYVRTFEDADGRVRFSADQNAMSLILRLVSMTPQASDVARNWAILDNPAMNQSVTSGLVEALARLTGLVRYGSFDPGKADEWKLRGQEAEFEQALRRTQSQAAER